MKLRNCILLIAMLLVMDYFLLQAVEIYVAPTGNDLALGNKDNPLQSLQAAKSKVRRLRQDKLSENVTVFLEQGTYNLPETLTLGIDDGGNEQFSVTYAGVDGAKVILKTTRFLNNWRLADKSELPSSQHKNAERIWVCDIPQKLGKFNTLYQGNKRLPRSRKALRYATPIKNFSPEFRPISSAEISSNDVFTHPNDVSAKGFKGEERFGKSELSAYLFFEKNQLKNWSNLSDVELFMFTRAEWLFELRGIAKVDTANNRAFFDIPTVFSTAFRKARKSDPLASVETIPDFYVENVVDYLSEKGVWSADFTRRKVYLLSEKEPQYIEVPTACEVIRVEGVIEGLEQKDNFTDQPVRNLHFRNLCFEKANRYRWKSSDRAIHVSYDLYDAPASLLRFRGAEGCSVEACEFRNSGGSGIRFDLYAQNNVVQNNALHDLGRSGISFIGYPLGEKDVNKNNQILNNYIYSIGQIELCGMGICLAQSGDNVVKNNLIHDAPFMGIAVLGHWHWFMKGVTRNKPSVPEWGSINGAHFMEKLAARSETVKRNKYRQFTHSRRNLVCNNELYNVSHTLGDCNPLYINTSGFDNKFSYNFVHDCYNWHASSGLRTDDAATKTEISYNIVYNCSGGIACKNKDNRYIGNYLIFDTFKEISNRFKGAIIILCHSPLKDLFHKTIKGNVVSITFADDIRVRPLNWPYVRIRSRDKDVDEMNQATQKVDTSAINENIFYSPYFNLELLPFLGDKSQIKNPQFKDPKAFDFRIENIKLLELEHVKQLDVQTMGLQKSFPKGLQTHNMRLID